MSPAEKELAERLREPRLQRTGEITPPDGGDTVDSFDGWKKRGRQVLRGARALAPRRCDSFKAAMFVFTDTAPIAGHKPAARPLLPGEDDLEV